MPLLIGTASHLVTVAQTDACLAALHAHAAVTRAGAASSTNGGCGHCAAATTWAGWPAASSSTSTNVASASMLWRPVGWALAPTVDAGNAAATTQAWWTGNAALTGFAPAAPLTPAEQARIAAEREAHDTARARAEELLQRHLAPEQRRTLAEHRWFDVVAASGARYRIHRGRSHNVRRLDAGGREVRSYCAYPRMLVPEGDVLLAQKLMLELAEDRFLAVANSHALVADAPAAPRGRGAAPVLLAGAA